MVGLVAVRARRRLCFCSSRRPYELGFFLALLVLLVGGMRLGSAGLFMTALLALFNIGGLFALVPFLHDGDAVMFIAILVLPGRNGDLFCVPCAK